MSLSQAQKQKALFVVTAKGLVQTSEASGTAMKDVFDDVLFQIYGDYYQEYQKQKANILGSEKKVSFRVAYFSGEDGDGETLVKDIKGNAVVVIPSFGLFIKEKKEKK